MIKIQFQNTLFLSFPQEPSVCNVSFCLPCVMFVSCFSYNAEVHLMIKGYYYN